MIYKDQNWKIANKKTVINDMYDDNCDALIEKFEDIKEQLNGKTVNKFGKFIKKHIENITKDISIKELKMLLYNNRPSGIVKE